MTSSDDERRQHYHDLLGVSPLVFGLRTLVIAVIALLVAFLTPLPRPLIALSAIVLWAGCNAFKDIKDYLTK
jgi:uncharacterized membrane protein YccC